MRLDIENAGLGDRLFEEVSQQIENELTGNWKKREIKRSYES